MTRLRVALFVFVALAVAGGLIAQTTMETKTQSKAAKKGDHKKDGTKGGEGGEKKKGHTHGANDEGKIFPLGVCDDNAQTITLPAGACYVVGVATAQKGKGASVDVTWKKTDNSDKADDDSPLEKGDSTDCICDVQSVKVHAKNGRAGYYVTVCKP